MGRPKKLPEGMWQRGKTFYARFRAGGRVVRKKLSTDFNAAKEILRQLRAQADKRDFNILDNDYSWDELKAQFLKWTKQATRSFELFTRHLLYFEKFRKVRSIKQITQEYVTGYQQWRMNQDYGSTLNRRKYKPDVKARRISPRTCNQELSTLRNLLNKGVEWGKISSNPIEGLRMLEMGDARKERRALTCEEVQALLKASPDYLRPVFRMYVSTGMRHKEVCKLKWDDIDFEHRKVIVRAYNAKSKKSREIDLDDEYLAELAQLKEKAKERQIVPNKTIVAKFSRDHVFVGPYNTPMITGGNLLKKFFQTCKRAGIEGAERNGSVDIHSLRVTFATLAIENGASPKAVQAILGHSTLALTMAIYAKVTEKSKREAIAVLPFIGRVSPPEGIVSLPPAHSVRTSDTEAEKPGENNGNFKVVG